MSADAAEPMAVSSSSGDSSDSDFEEVDATPEEMELLTQLETSLDANPHLYDSHVQYISLLRKVKMFSKLRTARESMQQLYPLTEELWLQWLQDDIASAKTLAAIKRTEQLFQTAVQDYLSVAIWKAYINYLKQNTQPEDSGSLEHFRSICEQAIVAAGLHISLGSSIWDAYRQFEAQLLLQQPLDAQVLRVRQLYQRQLQTPLADGRQTMQDYLKWEASLPSTQQPPKLPQHVEQGFQKAQQAVSIRSEHEAMVAPDKPADESLLAAFLAYIKYEEAKGDPARVQLIYERALAAFPVTHYMWQAYANYVQDHLKAPAAASVVYNRAVRNCPWVGSLWANALRALELHPACNEQQHNARYALALQAGLQTSEDYMEVVLARLDALRHKASQDMVLLRPAFQQAAELMHSYFPDYIDRSLRIHAYWADCELHLAKDPVAAEAVWEDVLKGPSGRYIESWVGYVTMLVGSSNHEQARRVYKRGYSRSLEENGRVFLCEAWVRFEREHGTASSLAEAARKVRPVLEQAAAAAAAATDAEATAKAQAAASKAKKLTPEEMKKLRQQADPAFQTKPVGADGQPLSKTQAKKIKAQAKLAANAPTAAEPDGDVAVNAAKADAAAAEHSNAQLASQAQYDQAAGSKRHRGLGFTGDDQPQPKKSKQADSSEPTPPSDTISTQQPSTSSQHLPAKPVTNPAPGKDTIKPTSDQQANAAAGQSSSAAASANSHGPPVIFTDECTAFVRGLDDKATEDELRVLLTPCGDIKDVRFVMDKFTGRAKGFGYVEFANNSDLQKAVALKDPELHGRKLTILVSKPPSGGAAGRGVGRGRGREGRGFSGSGGRAFAGGRGFVGGRANRGRAMHERVNVASPAPATATAATPAFLPRAVAQKDAPTKSATNDDFRQLLNKK